MNGYIYGVLIISVLEKLIPHYQMKMMGGNNIKF